MKLSRLHPGHFWSSESGMTSLLIFTVAYLFVVCALSDFSFGDLVADLMFSLIIVAGVLTTFKQRWVRVFVIGLAVATLALTWQQEIHPVASLAILNIILRLIFLGFLLAVLFVQVFEAGAVTAHRIRGAIVIYLLLGGLWSLLYHLVAMTIPNSFHLPEGLDIGNPAVLGRAFDLLQFHYPHHHRVRRHHADSPPGPHPGHVRGPDGAALPGHHPGPAGVPGNCFVKRKRFKITPEINCTQILRCRGRSSLV